MGRARALHLLSPVMRGERGSIFACSGADKHGEKSVNARLAACRSVRLGGREAVTRDRLYIDASSETFLRRVSCPLPAVPIAPMYVRPIYIKRPFPSVLPSEINWIDIARDATHISTWLSRRNHAVRGIMPSTPITILHGTLLPTPLLRLSWRACTRERADLINSAW